MLRPASIISTDLPMGASKKASEGTSTVLAYPCFENVEQCCFIETGIILALQYHEFSLSCASHGVSKVAALAQALISLGSVKLARAT